MPALAITGLIGSGKSAVLNLLLRTLEKSSKAIIRFSADEENRSLLETDSEVKQLILSQLGDSCYQSDGQPDRSHLFELISGDSNARNILEKILHPRIEKRWKPLSEEYRGRSDAFFVAEIPLLYEKELDTFFDKTIVVGCSDTIRGERLRRDRSLTQSKAYLWMKMQQSQHEKISRADYLLWNDGNSESLAQQIQRLISIVHLP